MITLNQEWKHRSNNTSKLTVAQLIDNTIREQFLQHQNSYDEIDDKAIYYQAVAILQEIL